MEHTFIKPLHLSSDLWDETPQTYYTVRLYNYSGIGVEQERVNVLATSDQDAKNIFCSSYRVAQSRMFCLYAFKQDTRIS